MLLRYLVAAAVLAILVAVTGAVVISRRRRVWRTFAGAHGLRYSTKPTPHVTGVIDRREVNLGSRDRSSDAAELGAEPVSLSVRLGDDVPADLKVLETGSAVRAVYRLSDNLVISTGDLYFDARFTARGDAEAACEYLNETRRAALLALADENDSGFVTIRRGTLCIEGRMLARNLTRLDNALERLLASARTLDEAGAHLRRHIRAAGGRRRG